VGKDIEGAEVAVQVIEGEEEVVLESFSTMPTCGAADVRPDTTSMAPSLSVRRQVIVASRSCVDGSYGSGGCCG